MLKLYPVSSGVGLSALLVLGACTSNDEQSRDERIEALIAEQAESATESQQAVLSDGDVDYIEYERAVYATIDCLEAEGILVDGPHEDPVNPGQLVFGYGGTETEEGLDSIEPIYNRCYSEHLNVIDQAYAFQNRLSPEEEEERDLRVGECMADFGVAAADESPTADEVRQLAQQFPAVYAECLVEVSRES